MPNFVKALLLLSLSGLLSSCGALSNSEQSPTEASAKTRVTILGSLTGNGEEKLMAAIAPFTERTGIEVTYEGSDAFATLINIRVSAGDPPDLALFPQPGLMLDLAEQGQLQPVARSPLESAYQDYWLDLASVDDELYGVWMRADVKSLVWYNPAAFRTAGYDVPTTWTELEQLTTQMVANGHTPWCIGLESGDATGWVGTDWVEDILLRQVGPAQYDRWVDHEIPFDHPDVEQALETFGQIVRDPAQTRGGATGAISTFFGDSPAALFDEQPGCYLHRQASFISDFLPETVKPKETVDVFVLPPIQPAAVLAETESVQNAAPLTVGGIVFAQFADDPAATALMEHLATAEAHTIWAGEDYLSPHAGVPLDAYADPLKRKQAAILQNAGVIRFDGSDLMPSEVGTGTFWSGIVDYVGGEDAETVLEEIEASWPQSDTAP